jgi:hypothetical protein
MPVEGLGVMHAVAHSVIERKDGRVAVSENISGTFRVDDMI